MQKCFSEVKFGAQIGTPGYSTHVPPFLLGDGGEITRLLVIRRISEVSSAGLEFTDLAERPERGSTPGLAFSNT